MVKGSEKRRSKSGKGRGRHSAKPALPPAEETPDDTPAAAGEPSVTTPLEEPPPQAPAEETPDAGAPSAAGEPSATTPLEEPQLETTPASGPAALAAALDNVTAVSAGDALTTTSRTVVCVKPRSFWRGRAATS